MVSVSSVEIVYLFINRLAPSPDIFTLMLECRELQTNKIGRRSLVVGYKQQAKSLARATMSGARAYERARAPSSANTMYRRKVFIEDARCLLENWRVQLAGCVDENTAKRRETRRIKAKRIVWLRRKRRFASRLVGSSRLSERENEQSPRCRRCAALDDGRER